MKPALADLPADYEPKPSSRKLVRSKATGDLGYLVKRSGKLMVKLDRPAQEILRPYSEAEWLDEDAQLPLSKHAVASVQFEADRTLCKALGMHDHARKTWDRLTDTERQKWMSVGPAAPTERTALYRKVKEALEPFTRG